tara:strand:+ start:48496 stop:48714 length:219 start_codon:yes stop_codon:yes gene_type:complete
MTDKVKKEILLRLASRIRELRLEKCLTQAQAKIDTKIHFGRIEQGKRDISYTTLHKICEYFEISMKEFFDFE